MNDGTINPPPFPMANEVMTCPQCSKSAGERSVGCDQLDWNGAPFHGRDNRYQPDDKGREHPHTMSEREMLEELVESSRKVADLVNGFVNDFKSGKLNPLAMMGGMFKR